MSIQVNFSKFFATVSAICLVSLSPLVLAQDTGFAEELKDYGVSPTKYPRSKSSGYGTATPTEIPGGKVISTKELIEQLKGDSKPVIAVAYGAQQTVPGAIVMDGAGEDRLLGLDKEKFSKALEKITAGNKAQPIVFYCHSSKCWLSYNASLHAIELGYSSVLWYRGGRDAWKEAKQKFVAPAGSW